ncbi:hypothetical protein NP493_874g01044 [Ridgeia piscesae]|uniref:Cadherin domain-containing protein n=1 Tax=Ridgeia piscesae TaxID=27915 RepID=A0AAD9KL43_RIDPI|nr:hypothetical protein NP493_874g01044 [Ridgeia piscesae]
MLTQVHLKIIVAEKNQFAPKFERDSYTAEVFRYSDPDTHVLTLRATDFDTEAHNGDVSYVLEEGDNEGAVVLDGSSGELRVAEGLRKAKTRLVLYVTATDHGSPRLQDRANVTLHVRNISGTHVTSLSYFELVAKSLQTLFQISLLCRLSK